MNFFSHAAIASQKRDEPGFVLGAMLPDFATMIGARTPRMAHDAVDAGVRFHHRTDHVFHDCSIFRSLCSSAFSDLQARGVRRGTARAVAHVGVELLLDAVLANDAKARAAYREAVQQASDEHLGAFLCWETPTIRVRFAQLRSVLEERGVRSDLASPELVTLRLTRALADRPRLRLDAGAEEPVLDWTREIRPIVFERAPELFRELWTGLAEE